MDTEHTHQHIINKDTKLSWANYIIPMDHQELAGALFFKCEAPRGVYCKCCREGRVNLDPLPEPLDFIRELFDSMTPKSRESLRQCRIYTNALSLAATSLSFRQFKTSGPPCIGVNGLIHHRAVSLKWAW